MLEHQSPLNIHIGTRHGKRQAAVLQHAGEWQEIMALTLAQDVAPMDEQHLQAAQPSHRCCTRQHRVCKWHMISPDDSTRGACAGEARCMQLWWRLPCSATHLLAQHLPRLLALGGGQLVLQVRPLRRAQDGAVDVLHPKTQIVGVPQPDTPSWDTSSLGTTCSVPSEPARFHRRHPDVMWALRGQ